MYSIWNSLLTLLSEPVLEDIHAKVVKLLVTLLGLIKTKNVSMFSSLLEEIIKILTGVLVLLSSFEALDCIDIVGIVWLQLLVWSA